MKNSLWIILMTICSSFATAADFVDTAKIVSSTSILERIPAPREGAYLEVIRGYNVTYRYNGRDVTAKLLYKPGETLNVQVGPVGTDTRCDAVDSAKIISVAPNFERVKEGDHYRDAFTGVKVNYLYNGREVNTILPGTDGPQTSLLKLCLVAVSNENGEVAQAKNNEPKSANVSDQSTVNIVINSDCGKIPLGERWEDNQSYIFAKAPPDFDFGDNQLVEKTLGEVIRGNRIALELVNKVNNEIALHGSCSRLLAVLASRYPKGLGVSDSCRVPSIIECFENQTGIDANIPYAYFQVVALDMMKAGKIGIWGEKIYHNIYLEKKAEAQKQKAEAQKLADANEKIKKTEQALLSEALRVNNISPNHHHREVFEVVVKDKIRTNGCALPDVQCKDFRLVGIDSMPISRADGLNGITQKWRITLSFLFKPKNGKWRDDKRISEWHKIGTAWEFKGESDNM